MKTIPLNEAQMHLDRYGRLYRKEQIVVTVKGKPSFKLVPCASDETFISDLIESNAEFGALLKRRRKDKVLSTEKLLEKLGRK